jgi:hypothetical protein
MIKRACGVFALALLLAPACVAGSLDPSGQAWRPGAAARVNLGELPSNRFASLSMDSNGALMTDGGGGGSAHTTDPRGYNWAPGPNTQALLGQLPSGAWAPLSLDALGNLYVDCTTGCGGGGGGGVTLPNSAPLLATDGSGNPVVISIGSGLTIQSNTLINTLTVPTIPHSAPLLGSDSSGNPTAVTAGTGISIAGGVISATGGGGATGTSALDPYDAGPDLTVSGLTVSNSTSNPESVRSTIARSGKVCFEVTFTKTAGGQFGIGISNNPGALMNFPGADAYSLGYWSGTQTLTFGNGSGPFLPGAGNGDVWDLCEDSANESIWVRDNGGNWNANASANPATNTGGSAGTVSPLSGRVFKLPVYAFVAVTGAGNSATVNFGASSFVYALPSGFSAWQ